MVAGPDDQSYAHYGPVGDHRLMGALPIAAVGPAVLPAVANGQGTAAIVLLLLVAAVALGAHYGGVRAGLMAAVLGSLVSLLLGPASLPATVLQTGVFVFAAVCTIVVVAQRRRAQEQLCRFADLVGAITGDPEEAVCALDREGHIMFVNPAAVAKLGWSEAELLGKDLHQLVHDPTDMGCPVTPGDVCPLGAILRAGSSTQTGSSEFKTRDNHRAHVAYTSLPMLRNGRVQGVVLTLRDAVEPGQVVESLRESEERYRSLVETSPDGIIMTDLYGYITMANRRAARLYGYDSSDSLVGMRIVELVAPEDRLRAVEDGRNVRVAGVVSNAEYKALMQDGNTFPVEIRASLIRDREGTPKALIHACRDVTERRRADETLRSGEICAATRDAATVALARSVTIGESLSNVVRSLCENAGWDTGVVWEVHERDTLLRCHTIWHNPSLDIARFEEVSQQFSFARGEDLPGRVWESGRATWIRDIVADPDFSRALMASKVGLHSAFCMPIFVHGAVRGVIELFSSDIRWSNDALAAAMTTVAGQLGQFIERKETEKALEYQARHDALTDLPNRVLLHERMQRALRAAIGQNDNHVTLLLMDLDRFKEVNDTLGHHCGDLLLQQVASRLQSALRDSDTIARLGGDEFAALLPATDVTGAELVAQKILRALVQPFVLEGQQVDIGASIGIASHPRHASDASTLMQRADVAMYSAKRARAGYAVYAADQDQGEPDRLALLGELRQAIDQEQLLVHYQPKIHLRTGRVESVETLARWHHPVHGLIPPERFIPLAEHSGLTKPLSYCVLNQALRQCRTWQEAGLHLGVSVNLSAGNLQDPQLADAIANLLDIHHLEPDSLTLEIAESAIMVDSSHALETLQRLHNTGVRISIDDFGTAYSSLANLRRLPLDEIKIDTSFVMDMADHEDDAFIARSVIDLGHNLGLEVVAEGVESDEIWGMLGTMGCDLAQGSYLSHPLPAAELEAWLDRLPREAGLPTRITRIDQFPRSGRSGA